MPVMIALVTPEHIQSRIFVLRGQRALLDADLARLYGVPTKRLNEQVKRNLRKFPEDFCFKLNDGEAKILRSQIATSRAGHGGRRSYPYVFTEHGAIQAANVLNSDTATTISVEVVRAFVHLRQLIVNHKAFAAKLAELDSRVGAHDHRLTAIVKAIRQLAAPDGPLHRRKIGFHPGNR